MRMFIEIYVFTNNTKKKKNRISENICFIHEILQSSFNIPKFPQNPQSDNNVYIKCLYKMFI